MVTMVHTQLTLNGETRLRLKLRNRCKTIIPEDENPILLISRPSCLGITFSKESYTTSISSQDIRLWGEEQIKTNQINLALHEAWIEKKLPAASGRAIMMGSILFRPKWRGI